MKYYFVLHMISIFITVWTILKLKHTFHLKTRRKNNYEYVKIICLNENILKRSINDKYFGLLQTKRLNLLSVNDFFC